MKASEEALRFIRSELNTQPKSPNDAAALGYELLAYLRQNCPGDQLESKLRRDFRQYIERNSFDSLFIQHVEYAKRLALSEGDLLYEEMLKLFYLCDEIEALSALGFEMTASEREALSDAVRGRFSREPRKSQMAAKQNVEAWKSDWWWYESGLSSSGSK
jgi:hypothetical protein